MSTATQCGLIVLGNSGVGKSFLANILIGCDTFLHGFQSTSVTLQTESVQVTIGSHTYVIYDIPGLIEAEQQRSEFNKQEIDKAFAQRPNSIIMFVFGQKNGRILDQDIVAFDVINAAYSFQPESLILVVNGISKTRPPDYEEETVPLLQKLLKNVNINKNNVCFSDFINVNDSNERQVLRNQLVSVVTRFAPRIHQKKRDIETIMDNLKKSETEIQEQQEKLKVEGEKHKQLIAEQKRIAASQLAEQHARAEQLRLQEQERIARIAAQKIQMEAAAKKLQDGIDAVGYTVPSGQTRQSSAVLNGNIYHLYGTMMGHISGHGTVNMYDGSRLAGGVSGSINLMILGNATIG